MSMIDTLRQASKPISTVVAGKAMSCGAVLFSCGAEGLRYMPRHSTLMIHDVSSVTMGKIEEIKADAKEADRLNDAIYSIMAKNVNRPDRYFWDIVQQRGRADWYLTPEEAVTHRLANHIRSPEFRVDVSVEMKFT